MSSAGALWAGVWASLIRRALPLGVVKLKPGSYMPLLSLSSSHSVVHRARVATGRNQGRREPFSSLWCFIEKTQDLAA